MNKIKSAGAKISTAWDWIDKKVTKLSNLLNSKIQTFNSKVHRRKKALIIITIILSIFMLTSALILASYRSVSYQDQGVVINYTEQYLYDQVVVNDYTYIGLGSYFVLVPAQKVLIKFKNVEQQTFQTNLQIYPSITARTSQGTKINVEGVIECQVTTNSLKLKSFLQQYGFDDYNGKGQVRWMTYLNRKIKNLIIQTISTYKFYQLSTSSLKQSINSQFSSNYNTFGSPFLLEVISLSINYPENSFQLNNTLGLQLLRQKSMLNQLKAHKNTLDSSIQSFNSTITSVYTAKATSEANIDKVLLSLTVYQGWFAAFDKLQNIFSVTSSPSSSPDTNKEKFTWLYFNTLYNATFRTQKMLALTDAYLR